MNLLTFSQLVESSLPARLVLVGGLLALFFSQKAKDTEGHVGAFLAALFCLAARDVVVVWIQVPLLPQLAYLGDLAYACCVLYIVLAAYEKKRLVAFLFISLNVLAAGLIVDVNYLGLLPFVPPAWVFPAILLLDGLLIGLLGLLKHRQRDSQTRQLVRFIWPLASLTMVAYAAAAWFLHYDSPVLQRLIVPVSYWWFLAAGLASFRMQDAQMVQACTYYEASIDSLYNLFIATGSALKGSFSVEDVLKSLNDILITETGASGGLVFLVDEFDDQISVKAHSGVFPPPFELPENLPRKANRVESHMRHLQLSLEETLFGEIARTGTDLFIPDARNDERIFRNGDEEYLYLASFMAVPLMVEDRIIGLAAVARNQPGSFFSESEFDRYKLLANFGTLALSHFFSFLEAKERSGLKQSADTAAEIQKAITPKRLPQFPSLQVGVYSLPAVGVSGDYYDVIQTRKDRVIGVVGDVAGKGVAAALVMVMIRSILHLVTNTTRDMATVLDWINRGMTGKMDIDHYATISVMAFDLHTGEVEYASAGHQPLLIYRRATDSIETIDIQSVPIGVERVTEFTRKVLKLADGDIVALYTDGIIEALNEQGKQYGRKSIASMIIRHKELAPKEIVAKIKSDLASFVGSTRQHDDQTVLVFKMKL
ncbi:MAG: hypothetical protein A2004_06880 [Spirochaetes bacterium GWC1_61_12]|nr:MAG: hypothetical protein A2Y37_05525 [Spirochaetes bacterium GWB1_60_80]OHD34379.1 MAG: hypothetical protein A2004_06880 [Spirochaetes bacterium GWC1_61_12]OHD41671.1 MAG: hypothetical protein A2Y35_09025 [Spirochaetes bacterium GWE1_60_18]OHD60287.1 MAG: hypothetical protein A2Y32_07055 [Spirochaetes bacterium GWF1_60_12]